MITLRSRYPLALFIAAVLFAVTGVTHAASSGVINKGDFWTPDGCRTVFMNAHINNINGAESAGEIGPRFCGGGGEVDVPVGWLQVSVKGYRSGSYCGSSGTFTNDIPAYRLYVSSHPCSNPSGSQSFRSTALGRIWTGVSFSPNTALEPLSPTIIFWSS
jgi:hypothetical protein